MRKVFKSYCKLLIPVLLEEIKKDIQNAGDRLQTRQWLLRRDAKGGTATVLSEFETEDLKEYRFFMRLEKQQFNH